MKLKIELCKNMQEKIPKINQDTYGEKYSEHFFEQYKLYLQGIEKISDRRENANKYFITVNSGVIVALSFLVQHLNNFFTPYLIAGVLMFGIVLSIIFYFLINSYKQLNSGKFSVLHRMEDFLPIQMYTDEWAALGEGKDKCKYFPFSHIERLVPILFGVGYFVVLIIEIQLFCLL